MNAPRSDGFVFSTAEPPGEGPGSARLGQRVQALNVVQQKSLGPGVCVLIL